MDNHAQGASTALIPVFVGQISGLPVQLCDARELHSFLQVRRDFTTWIKARIGKYGFQAGSDYLLTKFGEQHPSGLKYRDSYKLTLDMAKELAMVENNEQGRMARRYFIDCERQAHEAARALPQPDPSRRVIPAPPTVIPLELRDPMERAVFDLTFRAQRTLKARVDDLVRERLDAGQDEAAIATWLETLGTTGSDMALVNVGLVHDLAKYTAAARLMIDNGLKAVEALETALGQQLYRRVS